MMDVTSVVGLASQSASMESTALSTQVGIATMNKAMDLQEKMAEQLINSIPDPTRGLPENVGRNINVTA